MSDKQVKQRPVEFYAELLQNAKALKDNRIPVKIHPSHGDGGQQHWMRGTLVGVQGENVIVVPIHGKSRERIVPATGIRLWDSQMNSNMQKVADRVRRDFELQMRINNPLFEIVEKKAEKIEPKPVIADEVVVETDIETSPPPMNEKTSPATIPHDPNEYAAKLVMFQKLKSELLEKADTDGISRLRNLHNDLMQAKEMVVAIQDEIITVCTDLAEFGVKIPDDLRSEMAKPLEQKSEPFAVAKAKIVQTGLERVATQQEPIEPIDSTEDSEDFIFNNKSNWCPGKSKKYKEQIINYFNSNGNYWASGTEVMKYCGETITSPSSVLLPLVDEGALQRMGVRNQVRYRLKKN